MNRRRFLEQSSRAIAVAPFFRRGVRFRTCLRQRLPKCNSRRRSETDRHHHGLFPERFPATRSKGAAAPPGGDLTLLTAPKFIADQLGLHNVEIWSAQFAEKSADYCRQVKSAAEAAGSTIIDVQVDGPENLSDPDAAKRAASIASIKEWMDRAAAVGSPRMRANTGGGTPEAWDVNRTADSFRQLAEYGKKIGVKILIENHIGYSADIDKVVQIVKAVNDPNCRLISDWGNTPSTSPADRVAGLSKLLPHLDLVSAKELDFDDQNRHVSYDIVPLIKATEASGLPRNLLHRVLQRPSAAGRRGGGQGHDEDHRRQHAKTAGDLPR